MTLGAGDLGEKAHPLGCGRGALSKLPGWGNPKQDWREDRAARRIPEEQTHSGAGGRRSPGPFASDPAPRGVLGAAAEPRCRRAPS